MEAQIYLTVKTDEEKQSLVCIPCFCRKSDSISNTEQLRKNVEYALNNNCYRTLIEKMESEDNKAIFAAMDFLFNQITIPILKKNKEHAMRFWSEYKKISKRRNPDAKYKTNILTYLINNTKGE